MRHHPGEAAPEAHDDPQGRSSEASRNGEVATTSPSSFLERSRDMFPDLTRDDVFRLETSRLWLRWLRAADADAVQKLASIQRVAEMTGRIPHPYPPGEAERFVIGARLANTQGRSLILAVAPRAKPTDLFGVISVRLEADGAGVLGYWLGESFWGRGYATEAAHAMVDSVFSYSTTPALTASARVINPASRRVIEKCGFQFEGSDMADAPARGGRLPVDRFRLTRSTWESLKGWREPRVQHSQMLEA